MPLIFMIYCPKGQRKFAVIIPGLQNMSNIISYMEPIEFNVPTYDYEIRLTES